MVHMTCRLVCKPVNACLGIGILVRPVIVFESGHGFIERECINSILISKNIKDIPLFIFSDVTKISPTTTSVFLEVTSSSSLDAAKRTMDALVKDMLLLGLSKGSYDNVLADDAKADKDGVEDLTASVRDMSVEGKALSLKVRQVRVVDQVSGALRSVYPSSVDLLHLDGIDVDREANA